MTSSSFLKVRGARFLVFLFALFAFISQAAEAGSLDRAADGWVDAEASQSASDILDGMKHLDLDPNIKANLKGAIKGYLEDKLKGSFLPVPSIAMQEIVDSIEDAVKNQRRGRCQRAAANMAYYAASQVNRVLSGAARTLINVLESTVAAPAIVERLVASVSRTAANSILEAIKAKIQEELTKALKNYKIETFFKSFSTPKCKIIMRVIWNKARGRFRFVILGDCHCNRVAWRGRRTVKLAHWSVVGSGTARWIGEEAEKKVEGKLTPRSTIRGRPRVRRIRVKAACCNNRGAVCIPRDGDPWDFAPKPERRKLRKPRARGGERPIGSTRRVPAGGGERPVGSTRRVPAGGGERPAGSTRRVPRDVVSGDPLGTDDGKIEIPEIPEGPLCPRHKEEIIEAAGNAYFRAKERCRALERDYEEAANSEEDKRQIKAKLDAAYELRERAEKALKKSYNIPEAKECPKAASTDSHTMAPIGSDKKTALAMAAANTGNCKSRSGCVVKVTFNNTGPSLIAGVLPLVMQADTTIVSLEAREKEWVCATYKRNMSCYHEGFSLGPGESTSLTLSIRFGGRPGRHKICFRVPDEGDDERSEDNAKGASDDRGLVMIIQQVLRRLNYKAGVIDGIAGERTYSALENLLGDKCPVPYMMGYWEIANALFEGALLTADSEQHCVAIKTIDKSPVTKREKRKIRKKTKRAKPKKRPRFSIRIGIGVGLGGGRRRRHNEDCRGE